MIGVNGGSGVVQGHRSNEQNERLQPEPVAESLLSPESPNQPFHDLLHTFAQDILRDIRNSIGDNVVYGYRLDTQIRYERQIDKLLDERDKQRDGQEPLGSRRVDENISDRSDRVSISQPRYDVRFPIFAQGESAEVERSIHAQVLREGIVQPPESPAVQEWLQELQTAQADRLHAKLDRNGSVAAVEKLLPREQRGQHPPEQLVAIAAAAKVEKKRRAVLTEVGLMRVGNPPLDHLALLYLPHVRAEVEQLHEPDLMIQLSRLLGSTGIPYKKVAQSSLASQREELAWAHAREQTQTTLVKIAVKDATRKEIDAAITRIKEQTAPAERAVFVPKDIQVIDETGQRLPAEVFFNRRGESPFTVEEWARLPIRPVLVPRGEPGTSPVELAEFLFERVIYAPQVCDRQGSAVGLSSTKRQQYINNMVYSIEHSLLLTATQYMPLVAIGNPIKRNTQSAALAELDVMRRLSEIAQAVEMFYTPGMVWLIGNEAPAFQGPGFNLPGSYIEQFHNDCVELARLVDPTGKRIVLFDEAEMLWGTPERRAQWEQFEAAKYTELRKAYDNPQHPNHRDIEVYITTYIYPMSTCIDPYRFEAAQGMSAREVAEVYAAIKQETGSVIRGVGSLATKGHASQELSLAQQELKKTLLSWALDLTYKYRVAMESREELPSFKEMVPVYALPHTMVTKREKLVLYPNSGRGAYFPAHGEPVLKRAKESKQRTAVTVHPWWQIAAEPEKYMPMYVAGRKEPLYFEEV